MRLPGGAWERFFAGRMNCTASKATASIASVLFTYFIVCSSHHMRRIPSVPGLRSIL
jgi:hypothetical protein